MTLIFVGRRLRLYGVRGKNGGSGEILISGRRAQVIDFYAPSKQVHRLLFDSGDLPGRLQTASVSVIAPRNGRPRGYVNIEDIEVR